MNVQIVDYKKYIPAVCITEHDKNIREKKNTFEA